MSIPTPHVSRKAVPHSAAGLLLHNPSHKWLGQERPSSPSSLTGTHTINNATKEEITSPNSSHCGNCRGAFPTTHVIWCLICSSANKPSIIPSLCLMCYAARASWANHNHDASFYACDSDTMLPDSRLQQQNWIVRRNASKRLWYEHCQTRYKTHMRPLTAACELRPGWEQKEDPEGKIYYRNHMTGQLSRTLPGGLPLGWREAKDPDGKLFFVHDELQLSSWHRPGEQPPIRRPDTDRQPRTSSGTGNTTSAEVTSSGPDSVNKAAQVVVISNPVAIKPNGAAPTTTVNSASHPHVTLQTAAEATINLIDPSDASIVRNTRIATHIAHKGVTNTFKAIGNSERLQNFARGTGIAAANRHVKHAWRKAAREVMESDNRTVTTSPIGSQGQGTSSEEVHDINNGEYVIEYDDGMIEHYGADGQLRHTIEHQNTNKASLPQFGNSRQQSSGQQQYQNGLPILPSSTGLTLDPGSEESTQGLYAGQEQDLYADQIQDILNDQRQGIIAEQGFTVYQDTFIEQIVATIDDYPLINIGIQQGLGIEQGLGEEFNLVMTKEAELSRVDVDVTGSLCAEII